MDRFIHRHLPHSTWPTALLAGVGSAVGIGLLGYASEMTTFLMLVAPFGATCVLIFAMPTSPVSQPINVVGGHILAGIVGLVMHFLLPGSAIGEGLSVGIAISAMMLLRLIHPPAGATALVAYLTATTWWFILFPVATGSILLVVIAAIYHALTKSTYPHPVPEKKA
ncbi:MAG: HPP family protein [Aestuariivirga sp.]|jgi:CBS-domain-containing membrane protein